VLSFSVSKESRVRPALFIYTFFTSSMKSFPFYFLMFVFLSMSLAAQNRNELNASSTWRELGPTQGPENLGMSDYLYTRIKGTGRLIFVEFDEKKPERIFTGSPTGGLFISDDRGATWRNGGTDYLESTGVSHVQIDPNNSNTWFIAHGDGDNDFTFSIGIARTQNEGASWEWINGSGATGLPITKWESTWEEVRIRKLLIDPSDGNRLWAATTKGLFLTENALDRADNVQWRKVASGVFYDLCFQPGTESSILFASSNALWKSIDKGNSFAQVRVPSNASIAKDPLSVKRLTLRFSEENPEKLWVAYTADNGPRSKSFNAELYFYNTETDQWKYVKRFERDLGAQKQMGRGRAQSFTVNPLNAEELYWGNVLNVYQSSDGGVTAEAKTKDFHDDLHWMSFDPTGKLLYIATDGGLNRSADFGESWTDLTHNLGVSNMYNMGQGRWRSEDLIYGGFDTGNVWRDSLGVWRQVYFGDGFECSVVEADTSFYLLGSTSSGFARINGKGQTKRISPNRSLAGGQWKIHYAMDTEAPENLFFAAPKGVFRSFNGGKEWESILNGASDTYWEAFLNEYNTNQLYVSTLGKNELWRTNNARAENKNKLQWEQLFPSLLSFNNGKPISLVISDIEPDPFSEGSFWIAYGRYENGGNYPKPKVVYYNGSSYEDWTGIFEGDQSLNHIKVTEIEADPALPGRIYIGTTRGVFSKDRANDPWTLHFGVPHCEINELELQALSRKLRAATFGRGLWEMDLPAEQAEIKIRKDTKWTNRTIYASLRVKKGARLELNGTTTVAKGVVITVEPDAILVQERDFRTAQGIRVEPIQIESSKGFLFWKGKSGEYIGP